MIKRVKLIIAQIVISAVVLAVSYYALVKQEQYKKIVEKGGVVLFVVIAILTLVAAANFYNQKKYYSENVENSAEIVARSYLAMWTSAGLLIAIYEQHNMAILAFFLTIIAVLLIDVLCLATGIVTSDFFVERAIRDVKNDRKVMEKAREKTLERGFYIIIAVVTERLLGGESQIIFWIFQVILIGIIVFAAFGIIVSTHYLAEYVKRERLWIRMEVQKERQGWNIGDITLSFYVMAIMILLITMKNATPFLISYTLVAVVGWPVVAVVCTRKKRKKKSS